MTDNKIWTEALDIAKDQLRHGKVHYSDLQKATQNIYRDLLQLENGPVIDVNLVVSSGEQAALPTDSNAFPEIKYKHEIVDGKVQCAICGNTFKTLTQNHLLKHGINKIDYMQKLGISAKDMQGDTNRKKGEDNPLKIINSIITTFNIKRNETNDFVKKQGYTDIKDLMAKAKEEGTLAIDLLKKKVETSKNDENQ